MALVFALEPDIRQAAILKRVISETVHAELVIVDSRDAAMEALTARVPDVILLTALLSPRDEDELIAHLRTLPGADHVQTHTIPQLASSQAGPEPPQPGGLLNRFRKKKAAAPIAGFDPSAFADEVRNFLARAEEMKAHAAPGLVTRTAAPEPFIDLARLDDGLAAETTTAAAASAWSSPFEWKKADPAAAADAPARHTPERRPLVSSMPIAVMAEAAEQRHEHEARSASDLAARHSQEPVHEDVDAAADQEHDRRWLQADGAERERLRLAAESEWHRLEQEEAAAAERLRLEAEAAERETVRLAAEAERLRLEAEAAAEREMAQLLAEAAEEERLRVAAEAAAREQQRLEAEAAERERMRVEAEAAVERERVRLAAEAAEQERIRVAAEAAERERLRLAAEAAERERVRIAAEAAEKERVRLEAAAAAKREKERLEAEAAAERERLRLAAETAEKERLRLAAEAAEKERIRLEAEAARREQLRLEAVAAAERERVRLAAEAAEKERLRLAAEAAAKERIRLEAEAAARREQVRLEAVAAAERERVRLAAEAAEKERIRVAAEAAARREKERLEAEAAAERDRVRARLAAEAARRDQARLEAEAAVERERLQLAADAAKHEQLRAGAEAANRERRRLEIDAAARERLRHKAHLASIPEDGTDATEAHGGRRDAADAFADFRIAADERRQSLLSLLPMAFWAPRESPAASVQSASGGDPLRDLIAGLSLPHVAGVRYGSGCRIRRVRVPVAAPPRTRGARPVILSRRALEEARGREGSPE